MLHAGMLTNAILMIFCKSSDLNLLVKGAEGFTPRAMCAEAIVPLSTVVVTMIIKD